jgi:hypothetical protein
MAMTFRTQSLQAALLSGLVLLGVGCTKPTASKQAATQTQPAPPNDAAIASDVQSRLAAESALAGQNIQANVQNGVVTLNGSANSDAARALAGNDAGAAAGVKTVINDLTVAARYARVPDRPEPAVLPPVEVYRFARCSSGPPCGAALPSSSDVRLERPVAERAVAPLRQAPPSGH